jgi:hypothetical protein
LHVNDIRHTILGIVAQANDGHHHKEVEELNEIKQAYAAIDKAEQHYRAVLRKHLKAGTVQQVDVATALKRTREMIRRDAMTEEERDRLRLADAERKRIKRARG